MGVHARRGFATSRPASSGWQPRRLQTTSACLATLVDMYPRQHDALTGRTCLAMRAAWNLEGSRPTVPAGQPLLSGGRYGWWSRHHVGDESLNAPLVTTTAGR